MNLNDKLSETSIHNDEEDESDNLLDDDLPISEANDSEDESDQKQSNLGKRQKQEEAETNQAENKRQKIWCDV